MDFVLTTEQASLRDGLRRALADHCSSEVRRATADLPGAVNLDIWHVLGELGVFSLCQSEEKGGTGLGLADATVVFEELGRALVPGPVIATFLAAGTVPGAAEGATVVGAVDKRDPIVVEHLDALDALLLVSTERIERIDPRSVSGVAVARPLDPLTPVHIVDGLAGGATVGATDAAKRWSRDGALLVAATQVGLGTAALDMAVDYAKQRRQFGRVIGSFQALKHMLADAATELETARAATHAAGVGIDEGEPPDVTDRAVAAARILASHAAEHAANSCIQVHGGMGYTWELDAHLYLKRSLVLDTQFGGADASITAMCTALVP